MSMTTRPLCQRKIRRKTAQTTGETAEFETFGLVAQQPLFSWTNGGHSWIQGIR